MPIINLPPKLNELLNKESKDYKNNSLATIVQNNFIPFRHILDNSNLYFFPDYTDHSIRHVEDVLLSIENLITNDTLELLSPTDIGVLVTAVVLHDIGMLTNAEMFKNLISGKYDNISDNWFKDEPTWKDLWEDYLKESQYWNTETKKNNTGDPYYVVRKSNNDIDDEIDEETITYKISHPLFYNETDKRFIGEFIRRHHARLAYEVALKGYIGKEQHCFETAGLPRYFMQLAGLVARSHGMNVRDTFDILKQKFDDDSWNYPNNIKVVLLMVLVRLSDYLQIAPGRTDPILLNLKTVYSPYSLREHEMHDSIDCIQLKSKDPERIIVQATPKNAQMYVKIEKLILDIQYEFDLSWAILGEVYRNDYQLRYRRITTNILSKNKNADYTFVPKRFNFKFSDELPKLLIAPLYGNNPSYGVRELVQNAVDACRARMALDKNYNNLKNFTHVSVSLNPETELFRIVDTGIGMNIEEIEKYFFTIGSSYDSSTDWKKARDTANNGTNIVFNKIYRTGHFGIGILAAFLIGKEITVKTRRYKDKQGYQFSFSLDHSFIQIDKVSLPDYGTCIEIKSDKTALESLKRSIYDYNKELMGDLGSPDWVGWYVGTKPKVEYLYNGQVVWLNNRRIQGYLPLSTGKTDYKGVYWRPKKFFTELSMSLRGNTHLYCNDFLVTLSSNKTRFKDSTVENYFPVRIPDLMVTDIYNQLPINLQRSNIDGKVEYDFENDLVKALYEDYLCQLLAINVQSFRYTHNFFLHKTGYTVNNTPDFPIGNTTSRKPAYCNEKTFQGKILVHIFGEFGMYVNNKTSWRKFMSKHPQAYFTFNYDSDYQDNPERILSNIIQLKKNYWLKHCTVAIHTIDYDFDYAEMGLNFEEENIITKAINGSRIVNHEYALIEDDPLNADLVEDLTIQLISSNFYEKPPLFFIIHHIEEENIPSSTLDGFIDEYAGGSIIIPYEERERRKKFKRIYSECADVITQYRKIYEIDHFK